MLTPEQEELQAIDQLLNNASFALGRAAVTSSGKTDDCLFSIATSLIAIAKLMQLQAEQNQISSLCDD